MAAILCIETATTNCSVALSVSGSVIAFKEDYNNQYSHAERLHPYILEVLKQADVSLNDLDAVAISQGPGSYTGLRIGTSAAKGLCYSLDIPLIAVSTLASLARQIQIGSGIIIPMLDARRMEAYTAVYNSNYELLENTKPTLLEANSFEGYLANGPVHFVGNSNQKFAEICQHEQAVFAAESLPSAKELALLVQEKYAAKDFADLAYFEPDYLKAFKIG